MGLPPFTDRVFGTRLRSSRLGLRHHPSGGRSLIAAVYQVRRQHFEGVRTSVAIQTRSCQLFFGFALSAVLPRGIWSICSIFLYGVTARRPGRAGIVLRVVGSERPYSRGLKVCGIIGSLRLRAHGALPRHRRDARANTHGVIAATRPAVDHVGRHHKTALARRRHGPALVQAPPATL